MGSYGNRTSMGIEMNRQLELFPELSWKEYEYSGKLYRKYVAGSLSYRKKEELKIKLKRFIYEYKKTL